MIASQGSLPVTADERNHSSLLLSWLSPTDSFLEPKLSFIFMKCDINHHWSYISWPVTRGKGKGELTEAGNTVWLVTLKLRNKSMSTTKKPFVLFTQKQSGDHSLRCLNSNPPKTRHPSTPQNTNPCISLNSSNSSSLSSHSPCTASLNLARSNINAT